MNKNKLYIYTHSDTHDCNIRYTEKTLAVYCMCQLSISLP